MPIDRNDERVIGLFHDRRDADFVVTVFEAEELPFFLAADMAELTTEMDRGVGTIVVTESSLHDEDLVTLSHVMENQPEWSAIPLIVIAEKIGKEKIPALLLPTEVMLLVQPVRVAQLLSIVRAALKSRKRQYLLRDRMAELKGLVGEVQRSNQDLQQFAYVASHDLQEPLRAVSSYMQLLDARYKEQLDEKARKYIDYAVDGARRMQSLIEGLLQYSRITGEKKRSPVDVNAAFAAALANVEGTVREAKGEVTADALPTVLGDETQLIQLFQNLIANGLKYRKPGAAPRVHVAARRSDGEWVFSVSDNGIGIEAQHFDKIFQIFQRLHTRDEYPGTGIGLASCKKIVERHGGRMWVESEPGEGSTFYFSIPATQAREPSGNGAPNDEG